MSRKQQNTNACRDSCRMCALCDGRDYENCYNACRDCDMCTNTFNPAYASPYYGYGNAYISPSYAQPNTFWRNPSRSPYYSYYRKFAPYYGEMNRFGYYENPSYTLISDCESQCGYNVCAQYRDRMNKYNQCLESKSRKQCNDMYGCKSWRGFEGKNTPPINPKYTNCQPCWTNGYTTF